jgi:hypothetical protein
LYGSSVHHAAEVVAVSMLDGREMLYTGQISFFYPQVDVTWPITKKINFHPPTVSRNHATSVSEIEGE